LPSDGRAPMPVPSPMRAGQNNRMEEDRRLIAAIVSQQDMAENAVPEDEEIEIASLMAAHASPTQPSTVQPPMPSEKPLPSRSTPVDEADVHPSAQLAYMPRLVRNGQKDGDAVSAMDEITSVARTPVTPREDIHTLIVQGDEVEIIPLPDEDLIDEGYTTITTLITQPDSPFEEPNNADRDVIRQAIAEAVAALEAADQQTVASISPDPVTHKEQETGLTETKLTRAGEEIRQIPDMVFVSTLQNGQEKTQIATLSGRAITFPAVARILDRP